MLELPKPIIMPVNSNLKTALCRYLVKDLRQRLEIFYYFNNYNLL
jgi:hypothetical protein